MVPTAAAKPMATNTNADFVEFNITHHNSKQAGHAVRINRKNTQGET